jgi:hypothetical protein
MYINKNWAASCQSQFRVAGWVNTDGALPTFAGGTTKHRISAVAVHRAERDLPEGL